MFTAAVCLATAIYFEARNQPVEGQYAVAKVIMNRAEDRRWPNTVCDVITQDLGPKDKDCQFSFYCDGASDVMKEQKAKVLAEKIALAILRGETIIDTEALWYHADSVRPRWAKRLKFVGKVGNHYFYAD